MPKESANGGWSVRLPEEAWLRLAPPAGGVGRWAMELETGGARIDDTLRVMTGLADWIDERHHSEFLSRIDDADRDAVQAAVARAREAGEPYEATFRFHRSDGRVVWIEARGLVVEDDDGGRYLIGTNHDVTALRRAQERAELLAGEMAHRMKNVLALVGSMFNMAARGADSVAGLRDAFTGRLEALAKVNQLTFTAAGERPARVRDLVDAVLGPLIAAGKLSARLDECKLSPVAAQTFVLVLNELVTNAAKYGALSTEGGQVAVDVSCGGDGFRMEWRESGGPPVSGAPASTGYGMRVLRAMTAATFSGSPTLDWRPEGLAFACAWPSEGFLARG